MRQSCRLASRVELNAALGALLRVQEQARRAGDGCCSPRRNGRCPRVLARPGLGDAFSGLASVDAAAGRSRRGGRASSRVSPCSPRHDSGQVPGDTRGGPGHGATSATSDSGTQGPAVPIRPRQAITRDSSGHGSEREWRMVTASDRGVSAGDPGDDKRYREVLAGRRGADAGVEDLVIAEHCRGRVRLASVVGQRSG